MNACNLIFGQGIDTDQTEVEFEVCLPLRILHLLGKELRITHDLFSSLVTVTRNTRHIVSSVTTNGFPLQVVVVRRDDEIFFNRMVKLNLWVLIR